MHRKHLFIKYLEDFGNQKTTFILAVKDVPLSNGKNHSSNAIQLIGREASVTFLRVQGGLSSKQAQTYLNDSDDMLLCVGGFKALKAATKCIQHIH